MTGKTIQSIVVRYRVVVKFVVAGGFATLMQLVALYLLTDIFKLWYVVSAVIAFIVAVLISFSSHKLWTFRDFHWGSLNRQFVLYLILQLVNLGLNVGLIYLLVDVVGLWYLSSQAFISLILAIISFLLYKHKIFIHSEYALGVSET